MLFLELVTRTALWVPMHAKFFSNCPMMPSLQHIAVVEVLCGQVSEANSTQPTYQ